MQIEEIALHHIYRSLDLLEEVKNQIELHIFDRQRHLFNLEVDVVLYDVTTYHFESVQADELKDFGFSKAGKFNEVQVVMGLLLDMEGYPIGYDLFSGNTFEGHTLLQALEVLKQRFKIRRLIFVADQGLNSKANLHRIKSAGYEYIVRARVKNLPRGLPEEILSGQGYKILQEDESGETTSRQRGEYSSLKRQAGGILVSPESPARQAGASKAGSESPVIYGKEEGSQYQERASGYLLTEAPGRVIGLDRERIAPDERWDGYSGIQCSAENMRPEDILDAYSQLWRIEASFRTLRSTMRTRPIYHWTPRRIRGHFVLCFMAFVLERALENKLRAHNIAASPEAIKEALVSLQVSEIQLGEQIYFLKAKHQPLANKILNALCIPHLKNVTPKNEFRTKPSF